MSFGLWSLPLIYHCRYYLPREWQRWIFVLFNKLSISQFLAINCFRQRVNALPFHFKMIWCQIFHFFLRILRVISVVEHLINIDYRVVNRATAYVYGTTLEVRPRVAVVADWVYFIRVIQQLLDCIFSNIFPTTWCEATGRQHIVLIVVHPRGWIGHLVKIMLVLVTSLVQYIHVRGFSQRVHTVYVEVAPLLYGDGVMFCLFAASYSCLIEISFIILPLGLCLKLFLIISKTPAWVICCLHIFSDLSVLILPWAAFLPLLL